MEWWWFWLAFLVVFLALPLGYGWGYRGWGPPYPAYYRRRRTPSGRIVEERVQNARDVAVADDVSGWGVLADVLWLTFAIAAIWWIAAWWW